MVIAFSNDRRMVVERRKSEDVRNLVCVAR